MTAPRGLLLSGLTLALLLPSTPAFAELPFDLATPLSREHRTRGEEKLNRYDWSGAIAELTVALEINTQDARALLLRSRAFAERARSLGNRADADRALADATRALELDPKLPEAYASIGLAMSLRCEHDAALSACNRAIEAAPTAWTYRYRGIVYWRNDDMERALADYTEAITRAPRDFRAYVDRADLLQYCGEREKALADAEKAVELAPDVAGVYFTRASVRLTRREYDKAQADAEKAVKLAPSNPYAHFALADFYLSKQQYPKAFTTINTLIELAPTSATAYAWRADCHLRMGQPDRALADCRLAFRFDPCDLYTHFVATDALSNKLESARALAACNDSIRLYPRNADLFATRAEILSGRGDLVGASENLKKALEVDPRLVRAMVAQAEDHFLAERYKEALAELDRALAIEPEHEIALADRGVCLERLGRAEEAEKIFALTVRIDRANAYFNRGWARLMSGDASGGFADLDRAMTERPDDVTLLISRAWYRLIIAKDASKALADANHVLRLVPENSNAYVLRAQCRDADDDVDGALADLDRALAIDPVFVSALSHRAMLRMDRKKFAEALEDCDAALAIDPDDPDALANRGLLFVILDSQREQGKPATITPLGGNHLSTRTGPVAVFTLGGIRIRGGEFPDWLADAKQREQHGGIGRVPVQTTSPDGRLVAVSLGLGGAIRVYDARTDSALLSLGGHAFGTLVMCFTPDGRQLVSAGRDGCLRVWDTQTGEEVTRMIVPEGELRCLACSPDGRWLASGHKANDEAGQINLWNLASGECLRQFSGHAGGTTTLAFLPDGTLLTGGQDGAVRLWSAKSSKPLWTNSLSGNVSALCVSAVGRYALTVSAGIATAWNLRDGKRIGEFRAGENVRDVSLAAGGRWAVITRTDGSANAWRLPLTPELALSDTTRVIGLVPEWDHPLVTRGMCHLLAERFGHAKADFTRAIELNSKNPNSYFYRALIHLQAGETDRALQDLNATIGLDEKDADAHLERGLLYLKKGEYKLAKRDLDRAIALDPTLKSELPADK